MQKMIRTAHFSWNIFSWDPLKISSIRCRQDFYKIFISPDKFWKCSFFWFNGQMCLGQLKRTSTNLFSVPVKGRWSSTPGLGNSQEITLDNCLSWEGSWDNWYVIQCYNSTDLHSMSRGIKKIIIYIMIQHTVQVRQSSDTNINSSRYRFDSSNQEWEANYNKKGTWSKNCSRGAWS